MICYRFQKTFMFPYGNIHIDTYFVCKLDFINIDLGETVKFKLENENSVETWKEVKENIDIVNILKKIILIH